MPFRVLVIEDDVIAAGQIADALTTLGFKVAREQDGVHGFEQAASGAFDLITLDRMLPNLDGLVLVERLRAQGSKTPVLMISALSDVDDRVAGLRAGGDDYLVKPFAPSEMAARVEALLRRGTTTDTILQAGAIRIDLVAHAVTLDGRPIKLLPMEYKLLEFLARHTGQIIGRRLLFEKVWGYFFDPGANLANVHIARLRKKLERPGKPSPIVTVKGEGYRLDAG